MVRLSPRLRPMWPYLKPAYSQATRMVAPVTVRASQLRGGYLPTGYVESMEEAAASTGGRCLTVRPPEMLTRTLPQGHPDRTADYVPWLSEHVRRVALAELPHGRVLSPHNAVITANDDLLVEVSLYFGTSRAREHPIFLHPFPGLPLEVGGRLGLLALQGDTNYYHLMVDVLPRLGVLEQCPEVAPPDLWFAPMATPVQRELLEMMGVDLDRVIDSSENRHVVAETLVVPTPAAMTIINPPWAVEFLRRRLLPPEIKRIEGRAVYVTRGAAMNNRRVDNESELMDYLAGRGFDLVDPGQLSAHEQIETFAQASMIVGAHSAGLVNLAFAAPGAAVVELFPSGGVNTCYWKLAESVPGLEYRYVLGTGDPDPMSLSELLVSDIRADIPAIGRTLDDLGWAR
ncbi:MAG TPA: glycosyltransferase family 61 protein [Acidimicrobiales bacterium]|nr:glycosyltransferase family 61 protein [Acidimicrobiales bacterium]